MTNMYLSTYLFIKRDPVFDLYSIKSEFKELIYRENTPHLLHGDNNFPCPFLLNNRRYIVICTYDFGIKQTFTYPALILIYKTCYFISCITFVNYLSPYLYSQLPGTNDKNLIINIPKKNHIYNEEPP